MISFDYANVEEDYFRDADSTSKCKIMIITQRISVLANKTPIYVWVFD